MLLVLLHCCIFSSSDLFAVLYSRVLFCTGHLARWDTAAHSISQGMQDSFLRSSMRARVSKHSVGRTCPSLSMKMSSFSSITLMISSLKDLRNVFSSITWVESRSIPCSSLCDVRSVGLFLHARQRYRFCGSRSIFREISSSGWIGGEDVLHGTKSSPVLMFLVGWGYTIW